MKISANKPESNHKPPAYSTVIFFVLAVSAVLLSVTFGAMI